MNQGANISSYSSYAVRKSEGIYPWILFLIWPFLALLSACVNYKKPWAKNIFWAYCTFYGFAFAAESVSDGWDIHAYILSFQEMHRLNIGISDVVAIYVESGSIDMLRLLLSYVLSRFTDQSAVLTLVYGAIFGYFLSRNIWYLLSRMEGRIAPVALLVLVCFFLVNPIWNINGFRMWTAAQIFIYGLLPWLIDGNRKYLWVSALSVLVHFSFIVPVGMMIGYAVLGNRMNLYFGAYIATFFVSELDITVFNAYMEAYAPEILQERTTGYRSEAVVERIENQEDNRNWYVRWYRRALTWIIMGFMMVLFIKGRKVFRDKPYLANLFGFTLMFYSAANILSLLPSGGRFLTIGHMCALALITLYVQNVERESFMRRYIIMAIPALLFFVIVSVRVGIFSISAAAVFGNPVVALFTMGSNISLNDFLMGLL